VTIQGATVATDGSFNRHATLLLRAGPERGADPANVMPGRAVVSCDRSTSRKQGLSPSPSVRSSDVAVASIRKRSPWKLCEDGVPASCCDAFSPSCCSGRLCSP
jgi:hypothetical protein